MGTQKVPGIILLHWNGTTYENAFLITFKVGSLRARTHTNTHIHTHTHCCIDSGVVGSADGRFLSESSGVRPSHSIWCPPWLRNFSSKSHSEQDPENVVVGWWRNRQCAARCGIMKEKPPSLSATCRTASSEPHRATSVKLARRNKLMGAPNSRCQRSPGTFWLLLVFFALLSSLSKNISI
jgi:hypothetical protein